jgi:uncharacterized protein YbjQ (UPF0145 family)
MGYPMQPPQQPQILVTTMNDVPGYRIVQVFGEVFGLTVRSRNAFADMGAGFKNMFGGEMKGYTKMLSDSRWEALGRLRESAAGYGANAVVAMRFESGDVMPGTTEIAAYGTAVYLVPDGSPQAQPAAQAQAPQQPAAQPSTGAPAQPSSGPPSGPLPAAPPQAGAQPQQAPYGQQQPQYYPQQSFPQ